MFKGALLWLSGAHRHTAEQHGECANLNAATFALPWTAVFKTEKKTRVLDCGEIESHQSYCVPKNESAFPALF